MRTRERREKIAIDRMLFEVHKKRAKPESLKGEELRLWKLYADRKADNRFLAARGRIRGQKGLREKFESAIVISGRYLPHMERIFRNAGLPTELTRLPFVESSFNLKAYSKVGAAGIWQFMPSSARMYMRLDDIVDDRRDPLFSTEAAAAHLRDDYAALQNWSLAVTAYNHGRSGVARGVKQVGSRNIVELIDRYRSRSFGFASKNFYASFLAAVDVQKDSVKHFGNLKPEAPLSYQYVRINDYVPYSSLQRLSGLSPEAFREYNPAYHEPVVAGKQWVPPRHRIRVPNGHARAFAVGYAQLGPSERQSSQKRYYAQHKVTKGESLGIIARRYDTTVSALQAANNMGKKTSLRTGQTLRIPPRNAPEKTAVATAKPSAAPAKSAEKPAPSPAIIRHKVKRGQTIDFIARQYNTSVKAIIDANKISNPRRVREGTILVIPAS
jgi:membrane-bound lytic murein transglycosylase D